VRGSTLLLQGEIPDVEKATSFINELRGLRRDGFTPGPDDVKLALRSLADGEHVSLKALFSHTIPVSSSPWPFTPS
jgi:hypothetical protein